MSARAFVTGGNGQDGWYLIELLLSRGYVVHAHARRPPRADEHQGKVVWYDGELTDPAYLSKTLHAAKADEIYNLAAISRPSVSWTMPVETTALNAVVPQLICEFIARNSPECRLFQASSSDMFDNTTASQNELTSLRPSTPYGIAKAFAHRMIGAYRERDNLHLSCGIMFNHESPRRPLAFVSQKIAHAAAAIALGINETTELDERGLPIVQDGMLRLGDIEVRRDFGFAGDFVEAIHAIVRSPEPDDFVIGTGESHSIAEFCERAFAAVGLDWRAHVSTDAALVRKADSRYTEADASRLRTKLGWRPKVGFESLVRMMVESRLALLKSQRDAAQEAASGHQSARCSSDRSV